MWSYSKKSILAAVPIVWLLLTATTAFGGAYQVAEVAADWETLTANRLQAETADYQFNYGDDEYQVYTLPWNFTWYQQNFTEIVADTNGNIWFNPSNLATLPVNHDLAGSTGTPVISAWNTDLSSYYAGGVFIEHKASPERVVVQWTTETWNEQASHASNKFQAVLFQDGTIQFNYLEFADTASTDSGSGISLGDGQDVFNLSQTAGAVPTLAGRSFVFSLKDTDGDGQPDIEDTDDDNDGLSDVWEIANGLDPLAAADVVLDGDGDGLDNLGEYLAGADPSNPDCDGDGVPDGWEVDHGFDPLASSDAGIDSDGDGRTNLEEFLAGSHPWAYDPPGNADTIGVRRGGSILLTNSNPPTVASIVFSFGFTDVLEGDVVFAGDWDGDGHDTAGMRRGNTFYLRNTHTFGDADIEFTFGEATDKVIIGDWDGDGIDTVGCKRDSYFYLKNSNSSGDADLIFQYGFRRASPRDVALAGDWDGDGIDTIGVRRDNTYYLRNRNDLGRSNYIFAFGLSTDQIVVGDWDGDGTDTIGVKRGTEYFLKNANDASPADMSFIFGEEDDVPIAGKW
ncbi:MAG: hypothetical protein JXK94_07580 [Deltaproteobacteria bacterium]|nr:hypothetical protein [Deltaproteobacteria bacterium]